MKREVVLLIVIYCLAHFPLLFTNGYFYDDWVLYNPDPQMNIGLWWHTGRPLNGYFFNMLHAIDGAFLPRWITFVMYFLSALFLLHVLRTIDIFDSTTRLFVVAVFAVFPADNTRILAMLAADSVYLCSFFFGWYLIAVYMQKKTLLLRVAALFSFLLSFWLNSLLVLFALVVIYMLYMFSPAKLSFQILRRFLSKYPDFVLLPVAFFLMQRLFFPPLAESTGYNHFHFSGLLLPLYWLKALKGALFEPMLYSVVPFETFWFCVTILIFFTLFLILRNALAEPAQNRRSDIAVLICGVCALLLALFPYLAVGKIPSSWDWDSRHARLVPLGVGLILWGGGRLIEKLMGINFRTFLFAYCILLSVMISGNLQRYCDYWLDWYKAVSLAEEFRLSSEMKNGTSFLFQDECRNWNAVQREYRFYEYSALMNMAFGDDSRFGTEEERWKGLDRIIKSLSGLRTNPSNIDYTKAYFVSNWAPKAPEYRVRIMCGDAKPTPVELLGFKLLELSKSDNYILPDIVKLKVTPLIHENTN